MLNYCFFFLKKHLRFYRWGEVFQLRFRYLTFFKQFTDRRKLSEEDLDFNPLTRLKQQVIGINILMDRSIRSFNIPPEQSPRKPPRALELLKSVLFKYPPPPGGYSILDQALKP